mmetsp:Transcript_51053/g.81320  ORF Transcript_51053/g.81320 Transcript_51053/m.81320 type:complete len:250 (+) Transcript_51053:655-1404(+)
MLHTPMPTLSPCLTVTSHFAFILFFTTNLPKQLFPSLILAFVETADFSICSLGPLWSHLSLLTSSRLLQFTSSLFLDLDFFIDFESSFFSSSASFLPFFLDGVIEALFPFFFASDGDKFFSFFLEAVVGVFVFDAFVPVFFSAAPFFFDFEATPFFFDADSVAPFFFAAADVALPFFLLLLSSPLPFFAPLLSLPAALDLLFPAFPALLFSPAAFSTFSSSSEDLFVVGEDLPDCFCLFFCMVVYESLR